MPTDDDRLLSSREVALMLGVTDGALRAWRSRRRGPRYYLVGALPRYRMSDVMAWLEERAVDPEK